MSGTGDYHGKRFSTEEDAMLKIDQTRFAVADALFRAHMLERSGGVPFTGFDHPFLMSDEINYKHVALADAGSALQLARWDGWQSKTGNILNATQEACKSRNCHNFLIHRYGRNNPDACLYIASEKGIETELEAQLHQFLKGGPSSRSEYGPRFDEFAGFLRKNGLGCPWAFMAYLSFLLRPQEYFPILPGAFQRLVDYYGVDAKISGRVEWSRYCVLLDLADTLRDRLLLYGRASAIEIQSYMWVVSYLIRDEDVSTPSTASQPPEFDSELKERAARAVERERIGLLGERIVYELEKAKLERLGRGDLADIVAFLSSGPGSHPYDILSFDDNGDEVHIEVKATSRDSSNDGGFWLSDGERQCATADPLWHVYRVWNVDSTPSFEDLGNIVVAGRDDWQMEPSSWFVQRIP
jgi:hypothetical protein